MRIETSMVLPYYQTDKHLRRRIKKTLEDHVVQEEASSRDERDFQQESPSEESEDDTSENPASTGFHIVA